MKILPPWPNNKKGLGWSNISCVPFSFENGILASVYHQGLEYSKKIWLWVYAFRKAVRIPIAFAFKA